MAPISREPRYTADINEVAKYASLTVEGTTYEISLSCAVELIVKNSPSTILEVGCGTGRVTRYLQNFLSKTQIVGVDLSMNMLVNARGITLINNSRFVQVSESCLPFKNQGFEMVLVANVIEEIHEEGQFNKFFSECFRVLEPGGKFVLIFTNPEVMEKGANFKSYYYPNPINGINEKSIVQCMVKSPSGIIQINDIYRSQKTILNTVKEAGFQILNIEKPIDNEQNNSDFDDCRVAPDIVLVGMKPIKPYEG